VLPLGEVAVDDATQAILDLAVVTRGDRVEQRLQRGLGLRKVRAAILREEVSPDLATITRELELPRPVPLRVVAAREQRRLRLRDRSAAVALEDLRECGGSLLEVGRVEIEGREAPAEQRVIFEASAGSGVSSSLFFISSASCRWLNPRTSSRNPPMTNWCVRSSSSGIACWRTSS
jgi:hypothetical protein